MTFQCVSLHFTWLLGTNIFQLRSCWSRQTATCTQSARPFPNRKSTVTELDLLRESSVMFLMDLHLLVSLVGRRNRPWNSAYCYWKPLPRPKRMLLSGDLTCVNPSNAVTRNLVRIQARCSVWLWMQFAAASEVHTTDVRLPRWNCLTQLCSIQNFLERFENIE